ncbi:hypothetical protein [Pseudomonas sp. C9-3]|nr:hypothetical protein [Pseudomonas sp. C9-3]
MDWGEIFHDALYTVFDFTEPNAWFIWGWMVVAAAVKAFSEPLP